jgi:hypothetical protein
MSAILHKISMRVGLTRVVTSTNKGNKNVGHSDSDF